MQENLAYMLAVVGADAGSVALSGEPLSVGQIAAYVVAILVSGGAAWKVLPILLARLGVALAGAKSEKDAIERLEGQLAVERQAASDARAAANAAFKERNDILRELATVQAQLAALTERSTYQASTIATLTDEVKRLQEVIHGKKPL